MVSPTKLHQDAARQRVCIYGPPKSGKTELMARLTDDDSKRLWWFDGERGYSPIFKLPPEKQEHITVFCCHDRNVPTFIRTMLKVVTGTKGTVCYDHGAWNCPVCASNPQSVRDEICLNTFGPNDILVIDSLSALADSALAHARGDITDPTAQITWDHWGAQGALIATVLRACQNKGINVVVSSHEQEVEMEDGTTLLVPVCGTRNASRNTGKYFDHVAYARVMNKSHAIGSATTYLNKIMTGSRTDVGIEGMSVASLLPFFDPNHPFNIATKEKAEAKKAAAVKTAGAATSALAKLRLGAQSVKS